MREERGAFAPKGPLCSGTHRGPLGPPAPPRGPFDPPAHQRSPLGPLAPTRGPSRPAIVSAPKCPAPWPGQHEKRRVRTSASSCPWLALVGVEVPPVVSAGHLGHESAEIGRLRLYIPGKQVMEGVGECVGEGGREEMEGVWREKSGRGGS